LNIKASSLTDKFFGESDHLVTAMFSLARKLGPTVVFIDEIETLLRKRGNGAGGSDALHSMQGVFLSEWDGLGALNNSDNAQGAPEAPVIIMGATNRYVLTTMTI
jgi:ATPase family AAA domain-containing protein 1